MLNPTEKEFREKQKDFAKYILSNNFAILSLDSNFEIMRFRVNHQEEYIIGKGENLQFSKVAMELWIGFLANKNIKFKNKKKNLKRGVDREVIFELLSERDGPKCVYCGNDHTVETFTIEHFIPISSGGPDIISNMLITCESCNVHMGCESPVKKIKNIGLNGIRTLTKL